MKPMHKLRVSLSKHTVMATCFSLLGLCIMQAASANSLGRLFFTPEQRKQLEYSHARNASANGHPSSALTVNGIVQKQGGARTVWINGVAQTVGKSAEHSPTSQTVTVPGKSRPMKIKVGEIIPLDQTAPGNSGTSGE